MRVTTKIFFGCWVLLGASGAALAMAGSDSPLADAVKSRDKETATRLLKGKVDVNAAQGSGATALAWASYWNDLEMADLLIRAGANVNAADSYGVSPLSLACTNGSASMVERLLKAAANPNTASWNGETPLMICARTGNPAAVKSLLDHRADANAREVEHGGTVLMVAVAAKHPEVVKVLTEHGADVHARTKTGFTALMFAAQQGVLESVRMLLESGANVNDVTAASGNALTVASASHHEDIALFMLKKGADPNVADKYGFTALHYAVAQGIGEIMDTAPTSYDEYYRPRPSNMRELAKVLLASGANPNVRTKEELISFGTTVALRGPGRPDLVDATPFFLAAISADVDLMRILLSAGADPRLAGKANTASLMAAAGGVWDGYRSEEEKAKALEAVKLVIESGLDVNEANSGGFTPLHAAAFTGADAIVQLLVEKGAKLNPKSRSGETPWSMAEGISTSAVSTGFYAQHKRTAALLLTLGATAMTSDEINALLKGRPREENRVQ